jgi:hypothetical protein
MLRFVCASLLALATHAFAGTNSWTQIVMAR